MDTAARQFLRALRGHRSQVAFSRWLGYRGNVAAKWEGGHRFPTFAEAMRAAERVGVCVPEAMAGFHPSSASEWDPEAIAPWLRALQGSIHQAELGRRSGLSRQQVGRLLSGRSRGRLPEVMALVDAMTGRLPDLIGAIVPIEAVAALAREANVRNALARLAISHPWSIAAQAWLDTRQRVRRRSAVGEMATALGLSEGASADLIDVLIDAGAAVLSQGWISPAPPTTVELVATPDELRSIRAHWAGVSAARVERSEPGDLFSFNIFAIGRDDLERVKEAQRRFYREVRAIVAESPPEVAAMLVVHTAAFDRHREEEGPGSG